MADDNTKELKIHIVADADTKGFVDATAGAEALQKSTSDMSQSMPEGSALWEKYKNILSDTGHEGERFSLRGHEMRKMVMELNQVIPGAGEALKGLEHAITGAGGGLAVLMLGIEAAKTYWELYTESVKQAEETTTKSMDAVRSSVRAARIEVEDFQKAMDKASKPADPEADKLARDRAITDAQFKAKSDLLKASEAQELANATTPEQKDAIRSKYANQQAGLESQHEAANLNLLNTTISKLTDQLNEKTTQRTSLEDDKLWAARKLETDRKFGVDPTEDAAKLQAIVDKIAALDAEIVATQQKITGYSGEASTAGSVHGINDFGRTAAQNPVIARAVTEGIDPAAHGATLTEEQRAANAALTQLFAQYAGGIQGMQQIIRYHLQHSKTQAQEMEALKNLVLTLQRHVAQIPVN